MSNQIRIPITNWDIDRELARRSLAEFARQSWAIVEPGRRFVQGWHIDAICEHLEAVTRGEIRNLVINIPPRHMKSLLVSVFWPSWEWATFPQRRWIFSSYAQSLSRRDSVKCRRLIQSVWYQDNWGHVFRMTDDQNEKLRFDNDRTGYRIATSVGGAGTGEGGDRVVVDDPHKVGEAESKTVRESVLEWWDEEMSTRGNDPKTFAKVIVMQRVHENDLSGHVLKQGGYEHLCLPAKYEGTKVMTSIGWQDPRARPGELLWPERFGEPEIKELETRLGSYGTAGQLQQRPTPGEGAQLKRDWWKYWKTLPDRFDHRLISCDLTFGDSDGADYVVMQAWGKHGANKYLIDQVRGRMDFPTQLQTFKNFCKKHAAITEKVIEEKANGAALIATVKKEISGVIPFNPKTSKENRVQAISPEVEAGNVWLPDPSIAPWVNDFVEECASFPKGLNDDQVDTATQALIRFQTGASGDFTEEYSKPSGSTIAPSMRGRDAW